MHINITKKLGYRRGTARLSLSVEILSMATQLYMKIGAWRQKEVKVIVNTAVR